MSKKAALGYTKAESRPGRGDKPHPGAYNKMKTGDFDYQLPAELIAQTPLEPRDSSRLMVLRRGDGQIEHRQFNEITAYLKAGDVLVFNKSRVIPARLDGRKVDGGGKLSLLLLCRQQDGIWEALVKPARRVKAGTRIEITPAARSRHESKAGMFAEVNEVRQQGIVDISFDDEGRLAELGQIPLPPYIKAPLGDPERYQTVYARVAGSVAAPTAGLHFTPQLLDTIERMGVRCLFVSLHIGLDTFRPVREEDPQKHTVHREFGIVDEEAAAELSRAREEGRRIICVGTSAVRTVEGVARLSRRRPIESYEGWLSLFILPGHKFGMVDGMVTNFHLPRSTLMMLVSAFAGRGLIRKAYDEAIARSYRFYSFGDAMLIL